MWETLIGLLGAMISFLVALIKLLGVMEQSAKHTLNNNDILVTRLVSFTERVFKVDLNGDQKVG